jgi:electron transfer flavoprotein alpha subunit
MKKLNISFDYDSTISEKYIQQICKQLQKLGHNIFITTSRLSDDNLFEHMNKDWNKDLWQVCLDLNIPKENVTFTQYVDKYTVLDKNNINIHIDDDEVEIELLKENNCNCIGILVTKDVESDIYKNIK